MSIRSHYSNDSQLRRPLTHGGSRRNTVPTPIPKEPEEFTDFLPCEACKRCPYKGIADKVLDDKTSKIPQSKPITAMRTEQTTPETIPLLATPIEPKKKGLLGRFGDYVARNQAANKAAGDTSLMDDLSKWGGGITKGMASLGEEEIAGLDKKRGVKKSAKDDEELLDFLQGKKVRK
jgi:hypothetical protein